MPHTDHAVFLQVTLTTDEAEAYAQFLKRVDPDDYKRRAGDQREANLMWQAGAAIRAALAKEGHSPR